MRRERHAPGAATAASSRSMRGTGLSVAPHPLLRLAAVPAAGVWPAPVRAPVARPGLERHNRMTWSDHRHGRRRSQPRRSARCFGLPGGSSLCVLIEAMGFLVALGQGFWRLPRQPARPDQLGTIRPRAGLLLMRGLAAAGQAGGAKNSRAIPSGSRNETPEP
jgi:anti-sigma factor RsiW